MWGSLVYFFNLSISWVREHAAPFQLKPSSRSRAFRLPILSGWFTVWRSLSSFDEVRISRRPIFCYWAFGTSLVLRVNISQAILMRMVGSRSGRTDIDESATDPAALLRAPRLDLVDLYDLSDLAPYELAGRLRILSITVTLASLNCLSLLVWSWTFWSIFSIIFSIDFSVVWFWNSLSSWPLSTSKLFYIYKVLFLRSRILVFIRLLGTLAEWCLVMCIMAVFPRVAAIKSSLKTTAQSPMLIESLPTWGIKASTRCPVCVIWEYFNMISSTWSLQELLVILCSPTILASSV